MGHAVSQLDENCAKTRKGAGSFLDGVFEIFLDIIFPAAL